MILKFCIVHVYMLTIIVANLERKFEKFCLYSTDQYEELVYVLVHILEKCVNEKPHHNVIIGKWTEEELHFLSKISSTIPVHLLKSSENAIENKYRNFNVLNETARALEIPANNFIILSSSKEELLASLRTLKTSYWWNHSGFFLLVNKNAVNGSESADLLLHEMWTFDILSAIFLCYNLNRQVELYTFNPYNQFAPNVWTLLDGSRKSNNHPWRLFKQSWETSANYSDTKFCESLIFDKTVTLNNYSLKLAAYVQSNLLRFDSTKKDWARFGGVNSDITSTICTHLNASVNFTFYDRMGSLDDDGTFQGFFNDLSTGTVDFAMNMNLQRFYWKFQTYPHETSGFCIVTLKYPNSFFFKFQVIFTIKWWLAMGFTFLFTMLVLKYLMSESLSYAALEFLRMLLNVPTVQSPPRSAARQVMFLQALLLTMLLNAFFQSRLSSMNVVPKTRPMVDSLGELVSSDLLIYGTLQYNELLSGVEVAKRYWISNYSDCVERLRNGERIACLPGCIEARYSIFESDTYHISKEDLRSFFMVFSSRVDWPLLHRSVNFGVHQILPLLKILRFNKIIRYMGEAGFIKLFRIRESKYFQQNTEFDEAKSIDFSNLKFGFQILFFGLFLGLCILFVEIGGYYVKVRIKSVLLK